MGGGYVPDSEIGIEILKRKDNRFIKAEELIREGKVKEGVKVLKECGLDYCRILFFVATILGKSIDDIEELIKD